jgi:hypothetical protein
MMRGSGPLTGCGPSVRDALGDRAERADRLANRL